jgi:hypothetical protein
MRFLGLLFVITASIAASPGALAQGGPGKKFYPGPDEYRLAPRTALVIGVGKLAANSGFPSFKNQVRDAERIAEKLREIGFSVIAPNESYPQDRLTRQVIKNAVYDFATILKSVGGIGLVYFAGHGVERSGRTHLASHDTHIRFERDINEEMLSLDLFYDAFEFAGNPFNVMVIDACRNNPWERPLPAFGAAAAVSAVPAASSLDTRGRTVIATSTLSGGKALDGSDDHSPYALAFLENLKKFDISLEAFFRDIALEIDLLRENYPAIGATEMRYAGPQQFIFAPTLETFNLEKTVFDNAKRGGNRNAFVRLTRQFAAGYFYKAAMQCLQSCDFVPMPGPQPGASNDDLPTFRPFDTQSLTKWSQMTKGSFKEIGKIGMNWLGGDAKLAYIDRDIFADVAVSPRPEAKVETKTVPIAFERGTEPGIEKLSADSLARIKQALQASGPWAGSKLSIVGQDYQGSQKVARNNLQLLARQSLVIGALTDSGFHDVAALISVKKTATVEDHDKVELVIERVAGAPAQ